MKSTYLLIILFTTSSFFSSSQIESVQSYMSPLANKTYSLGDTIRIAAGQSGYKREGIDNYSFMFEFVEDGEYYKRVQAKSLQGKKAIIDKIFNIDNHPFHAFENKTVIRIKLNDGTKFFIAIEEAIEGKEFVVYENKTDFGNLPELNKSAVVLFMIKKKELSEEEAMRFYIKEMNPDKDRSWKKDEFLYEEEKSQYMIEVDSLLKTLDVKDTFLLVLDAKLKDYNFETNSFSFKSSALFYAKRVHYFEFNNYDEYNAVYVPKKRAHFYAKTNEKSFRDTRQAIVMLKVIIDDFEIVKKMSSGMNIGGREISEEAAFSLSILELHCVDNEALFYNYLGGSE